jgi:hypothetical protein
VKVSEIRDEREFYDAVREFSSKIWEWGAHRDGDFEFEPTPDELIEILEKRLDWVRAHKKAVDRYLRRRSGLSRVRVIDGSKADSANKD